MTCLDLICGTLSNAYRKFDWTIFSEPANLFGGEKQNSSIQIENEQLITCF